MRTKTLYDLLCVRADDDAATLHNAFRKAVKANHPDLNPDDPDAPGRFRQIVTAYEILRDAGQRSAYDRLLALERARRRAMLTRTLVSDAVAAGTLTFVLLGGYMLFAYVSKTSVEAARGVEVAARQPPDMTSVQTIRAATANQDQRSERLLETGEMVTMPSAVISRIGGGSPPAIVHGPPAEIHVAEPAAPTDTSYRGEPSGKAARAELADVPIVPSPVAQEAKSNESLIIANGGQAPAPTESHSGVAKAVDALDLRLDRGDTRNGTDDHKRNDESSPLDQTSGRSVELHLLTSEKDTGVATSPSSSLAILDKKHFMRTTGKLREHATRPAPDRMSVREAAVESRDMSQVALESSNASACAASCSKRAPLIFGVGF